MDKEDLIHSLKLAYYRAKCDIFYSGSNHDFPLVLAYERSLEENITTLAGHILRYLKGMSDPWFFSPEFLGDWYVCGKSREIEDDETTITNNFRFMTQPSMQFQVFASYWIALVGQKLDASFPDSIYANRLNRKPFNPSFNGNFKDYRYQYGSWQRNAVQTVTDALDKNTEVETVSLDVKHFYYSIPHDSFSSEKFELDSSSDERIINDLFLNILDTWSTTITETPGVGIPVSLVVSPILANQALLEFDSLVCSTFYPLFYGRYCDDIICIFSSHKKEYGIDDFFTELGNSERNHYGLVQKEEEWTWNGFNFNKSKCSCNFFSGEKGRVEAKLFQRQLGERTSEWRALPDIPSPDDIPSRMLGILDSGNEEAKTLVDMSSPTMMRMQFSLLLRDCETFARTFQPEEWETIRKTFLRTFNEFCMDTEHWFTFEKYFHRVLALGIICEDYQEVVDLLQHLSDCYFSLFTEGIDTSCEISCKSSDEVRNCYGHYLSSIVTTTFLQMAASFSIEKFWMKVPLKNRGQRFFDALHEKLIEIDLKRSAFDYFSHDLGFFPLKTLVVNQGSNPLLLYSFGQEWCKEQRVPLTIFSSPFGKDSILFLNDLIQVNKNKSYTVSKKNIFPLMLQFAYLTRIFDDLDFFFEVDDQVEVNDYWKMCQSLLASYHGYDYQDFHEPQFARKRNNGVFDYYIPNDMSIQKGKGVSIAVACVIQEEEQLDDILLHKNSPCKVAIYSRFTTLINSVLSCRNHIDYLVFPELAIPQRWFFEAVKKLQKKKINFISGIEYQFSGDHQISNCVYAGLRHIKHSYPGLLILCQKKQIPAYEEDDHIFKTGGYHWQPEKKVQKKDQWPPVIQHGDFFFSLLVCSELMNINYRSSLRGNIDCLFVPEWNRNVTLYNDLVQASANDLHAFIVQCNNNKYGDCRIRAPYQQDYERDIVKAKGGVNDYFIVGKIKVAELRDYQLFYSPTLHDPLFKPYPIGFEMSKERRDNYLHSDENDNDATTEEEL